MNKVEYLQAVREKISGLPEEEINKSLEYYSEMMDDRIEEGMSEADAVADIASPEEAVSQIMSEVPLATLVKAKVRSRHTLRTWEIILLAVGSPVWIPLLIAAVVLFFSFYIVMWSLIISFYAVAASFAVGGIGGIAGGVLFLCLGNMPTALSALGAGLICAGVSVFMFVGFSKLTGYILELSKMFLRYVKTLFVKESKTK